MKRITFLISAMMVSLASMAQTYKLGDMSEATFAAGGDSQWSFEKYNYAKGFLVNFGDKLSILVNKYAYINYVYLILFQHFITHKIL